MVPFSLPYLNTSGHNVTICQFLHYFTLHCYTEIEPINNPTVVPKRTSERKSRMSLTLNQKLEIIKLSEKGMLKAKIGQNICQTVHQAMYAIEFLKEIKRLYFADGSHDED